MDTNSILLLILSVLIAAGFAYFHYLYKAKNKSNLNLFLAFLRFLALFSIFLLLINPTITSNTLEIQKTPLVVVMDNSSSIPFLKAGRKSSFLIFEKGAVLYFVLKWCVKMLIVFYLNLTGLFFILNH
mgnify:FL=1